MNKRDQITRGKASAIICLVFIIAFIGAISLLGCSREKVVEPKGAGPCKIVDKLPGDIAKPVEVNYGNKVKLLGLTANKKSQNQLEVSYYWQLMEELGPYKQVFVHFIDLKDNKILFQDDHLFCRNQLVEEIKGKFIKETHVVNIPQSAMGKEVSIMVGLFAPELKSGPRLKIESTAGIPIIGNAATFEKVSL